MKRQTPQDFADEMNWNRQDNDESFSEDALREMHHRLAGMFRYYCGEAVEFELDPNGKIILRGKHEKK